MSQASDDKFTSRFAEIPKPRCLELLSQKKSGRVAWNAADGPKILPVTYQYWNGMVVFRTAPDGPLAALAHRTRVAFEIDEIDDERATGWSVLVRGAASGVTQSYTLSTLWRKRPRTVGRRCPERVHRDHPRIGDRTSRQLRLRPRLTPEETNVHVPPRTPPVATGSVCRQRTFTSRPGTNVGCYGLPRTRSDATNV
jgi:uncharacterized protein